MAYSTRTLRIAGASLLALLMIGSAYVFSGNNPLFGLGRIAEAQSSEELLREYAAKDSDTDGLPDWQEALYGTDPLNPESFKVGVRDGDAVAQGLIEPKVMVRAEDKETDLDTIPGTVAAPSSLTDRFAQTLLKQYLLNRGEKAPTQEEIVSFVKAGVANLSEESASPARYTFADVKTAPESGTAALVTYAAAVESAFARNTVPTEKNEVLYFSDALREDASALPKIKTISDAYANIAAAVIAVPAPLEAKQAHLAIANALAHMSETSGDMSTLKTDPLRALMGIGLYEQYANELVVSFAALDSVFKKNQVTITEGNPGHFIVKRAASAAN